MRSLSNGLFEFDLASTLDFLADMSASSAAVTLLVRLKSVLRARQVLFVFGGAFQVVALVSLRLIGVHKL